MRFRAHACTFLAGGLVLLLATGLYQRVANPALEYHLEHNPAASPAFLKPEAGATPPMSQEDREILARAMADLREDPTNVQPPMLIANIFMRHKDWHNAVKFMERAVSVAPDNAVAWHEYGLMLFGHNEFKKSAEAFERALALDPGYDSAMANLIILYHREPGKHERAAELARTILASPKADEHAKSIAQNALQRIQ